MLEYSVMHYFNPPNIKKPIKSNDLKKNLESELDFHFIKNYTIESIKPLIMAAFYLDMKSL